MKRRRRVKIIKGTPIYVYRGKQLLEKDPKLIYRKMLYDESKNITYVYLGHKQYKIEFLAMLIIILCVFINVIALPKFSIKCNYNSIVDYYDGKLFLNWNNPNDNISLQFTLYDGDEVIYEELIPPHSSRTYIQLNTIADKYECEISTQIYKYKVKETVTLMVLDRRR